MPCPDENTLLDLLAGRLPPAERERVNVHVEGCATCRTLIGPQLSAAAGSLTVTKAGRLNRLEGTVVPDAARAATVEEDLLIGRTVGEYVIEARLDAGGMGIVYRARHPLIGKMVAIKVLRPEMASDPMQMRRMLLEARAVNAIGHPNIVDIFGFGEFEDARQYLVMEHLQGEPLDAFLDRRPTCSWPFVIRVLEEICAGLEAAHQAGVVHRDLKPSNLFLVDPDPVAPSIKLLDFGLARKLSEDKTSGAAVGTPAYMAPEQIHLRTPVTPRTDLYSLGLVAYQLSTLQLPYAPTRGVKAHFDNHLSASPQHPATHRPDIPPALATLILELLAKEPEQRPPSAAAVGARLRALREGQTPAPPRSSAASKIRLGLGLALIASVAMAAAMGFMFPSGEERPDAEPAPAAQAPSAPADPAQSAAPILQAAPSPEAVRPPRPTVRSPPGNGPTRARWR